MEKRAMIAWICAHPWLSIAAVVYLTVAVLGWLFMAGAAIASQETPPPMSAEDERAAHRAAVEAGYSDLAGYVAKYGRDGE
jgi:hypothetical protein